MKQLFSMRSPLWGIIASVVLAWAAIKLLQDDRLSEYGSGGTIVLMVWVVVAISVVLLGVRLYNRFHPKSPMHLFVMELREEDEAMRALSARATRNAYIFSQLSLPFAILAVALIKPSLVWVIVILAAMGIGQLLVYLLSMRRVFFDR